MCGLRNEDENLSSWVKILLLALLLGSGSAAIGPADPWIREPTRAPGGATTGLHLVIRSDGDFVLYRESRLPPPITWGAP
jgi:hypothetical protein